MGHWYFLLWLRCCLNCLTPDLGPTSVQDQSVMRYPTKFRKNTKNGKFGNSLRRPLWGTGTFYSDWDAAWLAWLLILVPRVVEIKVWWGTAPGSGQMPRMDWWPKQGKAENGHCPQTQPCSGLTVMYLFEVPGSPMPVRVVGLVTTGKFNHRLAKMAFWWPYHKTRQKEGLLISTVCDVTQSVYCKHITLSRSRSGTKINSPNAKG